MPAEVAWPTPTCASGTCIAGPGHNEINVAAGTGSRPAEPAPMTTTSAPACAAPRRGRLAPDVSADMRLTSSARPWVASASQITGVVPGTAWEGAG